MFHHQMSVVPCIIPGAPVFESTAIQKLSKSEPNTPSSTTSSVTKTFSQLVSTVVSGPNSSNSNASSSSSQSSSTPTSLVNAASSLLSNITTGVTGTNMVGNQDFQITAQTFYNDNVIKISMQWIQSLEGHTTSTTCVCWCPLTKESGMERGNTNILASGDKNGTVIVWDIKIAKPLAILHSPQQSKKSILQITWYHSSDFLLTLSANQSITMWNIQTNQRIWSKDMGEPIVSISIDPFTRKSACMPCENGWILFVHDLNVKKSPEVLEKKLKVGGGGNSNSSTYVKSATQASQQQQQQSLQDTTLLRDFIYSPHAKQQLYFVSKRDVSLYDLELRQTIVGRSLLQSSRSADFKRIFTCENNPNILFSLHADGSLAAWLYNPSKKKFESTYCDVVKSSKFGIDRPGLLMGISFCPLDPTLLAAISVDGKIWTWKFDLDVDYFIPNNNNNFLLEKKSKWQLQGLMESTPSLIASIQVSPFHDHQIACGTNNGLIIVYDLKNGMMKSKHEIPNATVIQGVRWISATHVMAFSTMKRSGKESSQQQALQPQQQQQPQQVSILFLLHVHSGQITYLKNTTPFTCHEQVYYGCMIQAIRVSYSKQYLIVVPKDRAVEIWTLQPICKMIRILPMLSITALEWCPMTNNKELFFFTTMDGSIHFYRVENQIVVEDSSKPKIFSYSPITALAYKSNYLVSGDQSGTITLLDLYNKKSRVITNHKGMIRKLLFCNQEGNMLFVLYNEGEVEIWDLDQGIKLNSNSHSKNHRIVCIDWTCRENLPVIVTDTGSILIYNLSLSTSNENVTFKTLNECVKTPVLLPWNHSNYLRSCIENKTLWQHNNTSSSNEEKNTTYQNCYGESVSEEYKQWPLDQQMKLHVQLLDDNLKQKLAKDQLESIPTSQICLWSAKYFGDMVAIRFWTLANQFLHTATTSTTFEKVQQEVQVVESVVQEEEEEEEENGVTSPTVTFYASGSLELFDPYAQQKQLPAIYDLQRDDETVKHDELWNLKLHDQSIRANQSQDAPNYYAQVAQQEGLLNQKGQAVKLLLETPPTHNDLYLNYLHACLIAATNSQDHFKQTVQFVASSLVSLRNEKDLLYGIEFLVLIGEGFKACKILQDFDQWDRAAKLAKSILPKDKSQIILVRWANHLISIGNVFQAIGVYLSLGLFYEVLQLLWKSNLIDMAALFAKCCEEKKIPILSDQNDSEEYQKDLQRLLHRICIKYAEFLDSIGNTSLAQEYRNRAPNVEEDEEQEQAVVQEETKPIEEWQMV